MDCSATGAPVQLAQDLAGKSCVPVQQGRGRDRACSNVDVRQVQLFLVALRQEHVHRARRRVERTHAA